MIYLILIIQETFITDSFSRFETPRDKNPFLHGFFLCDLWGYRILSKLIWIGPILKQNLYHVRAPVNDCLDQWGIIFNRRIK